MGLLSKIIRILQILYENTECRILDGSNYSSCFPVESGKQGCIFSPVCHVLQEMIDVLRSYCSLWRLNVNLTKSKIMVLPKSPRIYCKWYFGEADIEIFNSYNSSLSKHLKQKLSSSKIAINSTWSKYLSHAKISYANKLKIFGACSKSILFYGAQIWGNRRYDDVEKLIIKRVLFLPQNTSKHKMTFPLNSQSTASTPIQITEDISRGHHS